MSRRLPLRTWEMIEAAMNNSSKESRRQNQRTSDTICFTTVSPFELTFLGRGLASRHRRLSFSSRHDTPKHPVLKSHLSTNRAASQFRHNRLPVNTPEDDCTGLNMPIIFGKIWREKRGERQICRNSLINRGLTRQESKTLDRTGRNDSVKNCMKT